MLPYSNIFKYIINLNENPPEPQKGSIILFKKIKLIKLKKLHTGITIFIDN